MVISRHLITNTQTQKHRGQKKRLASYVTVLTNVSWILVVEVEKVADEA